VYFHPPFFFSSSSTWKLEISKHGPLVIGSKEYGKLLPPPPPLSFILHIASVHVFPRKSLEQEVE